MMQQLKSVNIDQAFCNRRLLHTPPQILELDRKKKRNDGTWQEEDFHLRDKIILNNATSCLCIIHDLQSTVAPSTAAVTAVNQCRWAKPTS